MDVVTSRFLVVVAVLILPTEIDELHAYGIDRIYSPDDGRSMGLEGMIEDVIKQCDYVIDQPYSSTI